MKAKRRINSGLTLTLFTIFAVLLVFTANALAQVAAEGGSRWVYDSYAAGLEKTAAYRASIESSNSYQLDGPNGRPTTATLSLINFGKGGFITRITLSSGTIPCVRREDCPISLKADTDKKVQDRLRGQHPGPGMANTIDLSEFIGCSYLAPFTCMFSNGTGSVLKRVSGDKKNPPSKVIDIEIPVYGQGNLVFTFNVAGYDPSKFVPVQNTEKR